MLTSLQNPLVKLFRKLHQAKARRSQSQFLLEGTHLIQEALATSYPLDIACYTPAWQKAHPNLALELEQRAERVELVSDAVLEGMATTQHPDGIVAIAPQLLRTPNPELEGIGLVVETLQDPGNLGTIIRTAVATGVDGLWLSTDSVAPDHPKVLRASAGQWFRLPLAVVDDLNTILASWHQAGVQLVAASSHATVDYWSVDFTKPTVIVLGNEGTGLSADLQRQATVQVRIPMAGGVESLNVGVSAALLLYEARRQREWGSGRER
ncbi:TrmH family RNA methyltransferase [Phormidium tenue]|uniref:rRNA methyltransferase n=1 Tax=Phormidium tenue NIES-30 TaxID=549789 RepID=A0A1U7J8G1_9CYAN|nr:RNA methyltransferase [Phormidium tenue]MBD2231363.1 RNA methyltransferase [Phormidium tenue FACHB-1052]OKH49596.1 rRNA methyltransferase [Phormidium tenue NIES-30]